ncbi:MAG: outer membrane lipoprotein-sorting protein [Verrucomicrobia bacterium]|nr:outer membrane lipoprotein-sorting protein [Verrucomicrobiota bacterium]
MLSLLRAIPACATDKEVQEGQALAAELRSQCPSANSELAGVLKLRDGTGTRTEVPIRFQAIVEADSWREIYEATRAASVAEKLTVVHREHQPNEYQLTNSTTNAASAAGLVITNKATLPFAGSDFWIADLGRDFFHWPEQRLIKREMRRGRPCKILESTNPNVVAGGYRRVRCWIDTETGQPLRAEAYDYENKLLKEFAVGSVKKVKGRWELRDIEIRNEQTDSRTRLEFDLETK